MENHTIHEIKKEIAYYTRRLYRQKLTTSLGGNVSFKVEQTVLITPSQIDKARIRANDIVETTLNGKLSVSMLKPSMELSFHLSIYNQRNDVNAIIHAHPFWGTWLGITRTTPNLMLTDESFYAIRRTVLCNYATMGSQELANEIATKIKSNDVLILSNHGVVSTGKTLVEAMERLEVLENIARYMFLQNPKKKYHPLSPEAIQTILNMP